MFEVIQVNGSDNPADLLTKHICHEDMVKHLSKSGLEVMLGRHELAPALTSGHDSHARNSNGAVLLLEHNRVSQALRALDCGREGCLRGVRNPAA